MASQFIFQYFQQRLRTFYVTYLMVIIIQNLILSGLTPSIFFSVASSSAADDRRMDEARRYSKWSRWVSILGIVIGVIIVVIVIFTGAMKHQKDVMDDVSGRDSDVFRNKRF